MNDFTIRVGKNIRKFREEQGLTIEELAKRIGMSQPNLSKIERGEPKKVDYVLLDKIASTLGVSKEEITGWGNAEVRKEEQADRMLTYYEKLTSGQKRAITNIVASMSKDYTSDEQEILRKLRYITEEARGRILNQLDYEYELEKKKQKTESA